MSALECIETLNVMGASISEINQTIKVRQKRNAEILKVLGRIFCSSYCAKKS